MSNKTKLERKRQKFIKDSREIRDKKRRIKFLIRQLYAWSNADHKALRMKQLGRLRSEWVKKADLTAKHIQEYLSEYLELVNKQYDELKDKENR